MPYLSHSHTIKVKKDKRSWVPASSLLNWHIPYLRNAERQLWKQAGCQQDELKIWWAPNRQPVATWKFQQELIAYTHNLTLLGKRPIAKWVLKAWFASGIHIMAAQYVATRMHHNVGKARRQKPAHLSWACCPMQALQIDFIKKLVCQRWYYCLVIVDFFRMAWRLCHPAMHCYKCCKKVKVTNWLHS